MKSIRLSMMVYFLGLLAVALIAASLLVYRTAQQTLQAKQQATEQLILAQYGERCREEEARLNADLLLQAHDLARLVQVQFDWHRADLQPLYLLGVLSSALNPSGYVLAPTWVAEGATPPRPRPLERGEPKGMKLPERKESRGTRPLERPEFAGTVYWEVRKRLLTGVKLKRSNLLLPGDGQVCDYFQIDAPPGRSYHSPSMAGRSFPLPDSAFAPDQPIHWVYDDTVLAPDTRVRRVVLKASGVDMLWVWTGGPSNPPGRRDAPRQRVRHSGPPIYVHCAAQARNRDAALARLTQRRDEELADVAAKTDGSLSDLRTRLWSISLIVFAVTAVGSFGLVRLGLSPLRRLSDAVSQVSAKDFRLPLDQRPLPWELRPIADRLTTTLDLLKRAFAREKQAVADLSHELRTPLSALLTTTEIALRKPRSAEQYRELLQDCHLGAHQINQIIERLLTLARLDAGADRLRVQSVNVSTLAQQCAAVVRPLAESRGLKLTVEDKCAVPHASGNRTNGTGDRDCRVQIDPDKLREVLTNLLHNAIQYNRPGGTVDLRVARENGSLEVEVRDTGIGIAPEVSEHIFERFYRADPSRGSDELHAGLGLAIVKEYVDLMGGSIGVESTVGQGSTFRVLLPVRCGAPPG